MLVTKLLKLLDKMIGPLLLCVLPKMSSKKANPDSIKRILVIRPGGMGDAILLLPALKQVYRSKHATIDILCEHRNQAIFQCCPFINQVFSYQNPKTFFNLLKNRYDAVIDTEQSHYLSAITARFIHAEYRFGFNTFNRDKLFSHSVGYPSGYEADAFWVLFKTIFKQKKPLAFDFPYLAASKDAKEKYSGLENIICLFPGATTRQRLWPTNRWAAVCDWISQEGYTPVLIGGKLEKKHCQEINHQAVAKNLTNLCGRLTIAQTLHLFEKTKLLISTDSGILHLGVICDIPTLSLFGPSDPDKWAPKREKDQFIYMNYECAPCAKFGNIPPCSEDNKCMKNITSTNVINLLWKFLSSRMDTPKG